MLTWSLSDMNRDDDRARFDAVVIPHLADAFALARWLAGDRTDAEDIFQEACLRAFRGIGTFSGGSARAWLLTIVRRTAYSWIGKNRLSAHVAMDDLKFGERALAEQGGNSNRSDMPTPETELIAKTDADRLETAIAALPLEFRETFVLREIQGLDYREIAEVTAMPLGTVMSRLARARRRLIDTIGAER
jgi:RNA polymerase sigma factor (sigma-70 family)